MRWLDVRCRRGARMSGRGTPREQRGVTYDDLKWHCRTTDEAGPVASRHARCAATICGVSISDASIAVVHASGEIAVASAWRAWRASKLANRFKAIVGMSRLPCENPRLVTSCAPQLVQGLQLFLHGSFADAGRYMRDMERQLENAFLDPAPCTCSNEDVRKAQALREALRRRLLDRDPPESDPYWSVGAD